jgi:hypothetical protein
VVLLYIGYDLGVYSQYFKSHDLGLLVETLVYKQEYCEAKMQVLRSASQLEALASQEREKDFSVLEPGMLLLTQTWKSVKSGDIS